MQSSSQFTYPTSERSVMNVKVQLASLRELFFFDRTDLFQALTPISLTPLPQFQYPLIARTCSSAQNMSNIGLIESVFVLASRAVPFITTNISQKTIVQVAD